MDARPFLPAARASTVPAEIKAQVCAGSVSWPVPVHPQTSTTYGSTARPGSSPGHAGARRAGPNVRFNFGLLSDAVERAFSNLR